MSKNKYTLVDYDDYLHLNLYNWYYLNGYAVRTSYKNGKKVTIRIHREIMKTPRGMVCDHIDGDGLNNRRVNLRNCKQSENVRNRKVGGDKLKGVSPYRYGKDKWVARITINKKIINIGVFNCRIAAANAYNFYALIEHGEYTNLNDVPHMRQDEWELQYSWKRTFPTGVRIHRNGRYGAHITVKGKQLSLGTYDTIEEAARARRKYKENT
ncbi:HNH endonuclease [Paenibacillus sp. QZ-Y1]|uniref:HNH endonuclease n=1 Tax=Paenibacillus sp. QZ-Y1 TaxID=3414511 RepID=UPI003F79BFF8